jgi:hypothetical protein
MPDGPKGVQVRVCDRCNLKIMDLQEKVMAAAKQKETENPQGGEKKSAEGDDDDNAADSTKADGGDGASTGQEAGGKSDPMAYSNLAENKDFSKYFRMVKYGQRPEAAVMKMVQESVEPAVVEVFCTHHKIDNPLKAPAKETGDKAGAGSEASSSGPKKEGGGHQRRSSMRKIHWNSMTEDRAKVPIFVCS